MNRVIFSLILVAVFVLAPFSKAQATVNSSLSASPSAYTGTCPTDITFNGTIYLSNTGTLQYRFVRSDGSTSPKTGKYSTTYPAGGATNKVADVWYQVRSNGNDKLEVYYNNTIFLQSQTASFTVVCMPSKFGGVTSSSRIQGSMTAKGLIAVRLPPAPTNLQSIKDPQVCAQHLSALEVLLAGGNICAAAMEAGQLVLVWDYSDQPQPDGYRVYPSRTSGTPVAITTTNGYAHTMTAIDPKASSSGCYAVTAFTGNAESPMSSDLCVGNFTPGLPKMTVTFVPTLARSVHHKYDWTFPCPGQGIGLTGFGARNSADSVEVGFYHEYHSGCSVLNTADQGAVRFDVSSLAGHSFTHAKLTFENISPPGDNFFSSTVNCVANISLAKVDWSNMNDWIPRDDYITGIPWGPGYENMQYNGDEVKVNKTKYVVDVTGAVRDWVQGSPNFGFVFVSGNENTGANDNDRCENNMGNIRLAVDLVGGS